MSDITRWDAPFLDGWYPHLSPDGKYLLCGGGTGRCRVLNVRTKEIIPTSAGVMITGAWLNATQCTVSADLSGTDKQWKLYRLDAPLFNTPVPIGPSLNFNGAGGNVWAGGNTQQIWTGDPNGHARVLYPRPGHPEDPIPGYAATVDEQGFIACSIDVQVAPKILVVKDGQVLRTILPAYPPNNQIIGAGGYVGYGYYGPSWLNTPDNKNLQVNVTPYNQEGPPLAFRHLGAVWLASCNDHGVYLRPLGMRARAIVISIPYHDPYGGAVSCSVISMGSYFLVASADAKGRCSIFEVDAATVMIPVPPLDAVEPVPPDPPVTLPARATITSFETPVQTGQPSRAVLKVTQGNPTGFKWQFQDGESWYTAATNAPTDNDHHYVFKKPGHYPIRLQTLGVKGVVTDVTGIGRTIEVTALPGPIDPPPIEPPPIDPPPLPEGKPTYDGFVLQESPAVAATFQEVEGRPAGPSDMGHNSYRRLAEGWTAQDVQAGIRDPNVSAPGTPWFGWVPVDYATFVRGESGEVAAAYTSQHGGVTAGDMGHTAWRRFAEFWTHRDILHDIKGEPLQDGGAGGQKPPQPPGTVRAGLVRADGKRHFADDAGRFWPLGETLFWAMHGWKFERDRLKQNIDYVAGFDFDYLRILAQVGWAGNEISESWPDHVQILDELLDYAWGKGLRLQITCIGGGGNFNPDQVVTNVITAAAGRANAVHSSEVANEWFATFKDEAKMKQLGDRLKNSLPHLVALSSPAADEAAAANKNWVPAHGSLGMAHMDRTDNTNEWKWRHCRKPWEASGTSGDNPPIQSSHNEPGGPRSSVAEFPEAIHNAMQRATAIVCGWEDYCFHNGAGVYGQVDTAHNRPPNLWEVPGIDDAMRATRGIDKLIPGWCSDGQATRGGYDDHGNYAPVGPHPLASDVYWPTKNADHGVVRDYARVNGDQFVQVLIGIKDHVVVKARVNYNVNVGDPVTHQSTSFTIHAGESHRIDPVSRDSQGFGGLILTGTQF